MTGESADWKAQNKTKKNWFMLKARVHKEQNSAVMNAHQVTQQQPLQQNMQKMQEEIEAY